MTITVRFLPQSTPYDPAEDPPGSIDPLGTVTGAEQLAEVLFPGVTARMWRVRLLTFAALAAEVSRRVDPDRLLDARLALERLFVSAIARQEGSDPAWKPASRRLPGIGLARQALRAGDHPLEKANFLKGQGVNGPFGVISRLARYVGVVNESGELERAGTELLLAWAADQHLPGLLDDNAGREGADWMRKLVRQVSSYLDDRNCWPRKAWTGWQDLANRLRLDQPGSRERAVMLKLLSADPLGFRDRMVSCMTDPDVLSVYRTISDRSDRGNLEREFLTVGLRAVKAQDEIGKSILVTVELIDAYETLSGLLETIFRGLVWGLTRKNGQAARTVILQEPTLRPFLAKIHTKINSASTRFQKKLEAFEVDSLAIKRGSVDVDRMHKFLDDSVAASRPGDDGVTAIIDRHVRVQKEKNKGVWIEQDKQWTLMPGFGDTGEEPQQYDWYLHPYRVTNIYGMLADLEAVPRFGEGDAEEDLE